jgi:hypothetical protein
LDASGKVVATCPAKKKKASSRLNGRIASSAQTIPANEGMNRFAWDLRYDDPVQIPGAFYSGEGPKGPLTLPGDYQVKLAVGGKSQTAPLHLAIDPRTKGAEPALQKQFTLSMQVNDRISQLHQAVNEIRDLKSQVQTLHKRFGDDQRLKPALDTSDQSSMSAELFS